MENHRQISKVRLLGSTLAGAIGVLTFVSSAASAAPIILMSPSVNDGSFESVASTIQAPTTLVSGWSLTDTVANNGGLLFATNGVLAGANGDEAVFADLGQTTATFPSLLSTGYTSVHASDVFAWSFDVNSWHAASSATLQLKFSASDIVTLATGTAQDTNTATFHIATI